MTPDTTAIRTVSVRDYVHRLENVLEHGTLDSHSEKIVEDVASSLDEWIEEEDRCPLQRTLESLEEEKHFWKDMMDKSTRERQHSYSSGKFNGLQTAMEIYSNELGVEKPAGLVHDDRK